MCDDGLIEALEAECACVERDTCTNCGGTGVGGYHVHAPQEDAVEALRCEACDGFGFIEHGSKDCPATAPELPLMARAMWEARQLRLLRDDPEAAQLSYDELCPSVQDELLWDARAALRAMREVEG